jgi:hypothetical protein
LQIYQLYKQNYVKVLKTEKNIKQGKLISSEYENILHNEIINIYSHGGINLDTIHHFDFENFQDLFYNNPSYVDIQLKKSEVFNKTIKYVKKLFFKFFFRRMKKL